jgi:ASC-1-like (ASCH) protein
MSIEQTYIKYGVPSDWAHEYQLRGISSNTFKNTSKTDLTDKYQIPIAQIDFVKTCLVRKPIEDATIQKLLENSRFTCCLCKGQKSDAYIIHHIIEYSETQDNQYENLAVLCPNDHDLAHRKGITLTNKISDQQIRYAKKNWEEQVKEENRQKALHVPNMAKIGEFNKLNPYKELQSYTESDKEFFFGRTEEIQELIKKINKYGIVGLFGESGTGKTSLLNAGFIPDFQESGFATISVRCLDEPIKRIREGLFRILKENRISQSTIDNLAASDTFAHLIIALRSITISGKQGLIIIVDQFEELFTRAREMERESLAIGILEALTMDSGMGKVFFLLSLREDYIGELWDWSHKYSLEDAWIHQYRITRLNAQKAFEVITQPLLKLGIKFNTKFIEHIITDLTRIGDGLIYPPYLQIVCYELFEIYKDQNGSPTPVIEFGQNVLKGITGAESIIADYLSESMMEGLTTEERLYAQNILDLLTGPAGLRTFLSIEEISRYTNVPASNSRHVVEHLIKKKIVHPVIEDDLVIGYELIHDFLSKKFFEKLGPDAQKTKTTIEIFRKAFREWKQHDVLASKDRLEILYPNYRQLPLNEDEWTFLIKSSFSVYWDFENKWKETIDKQLLCKICFALINDKVTRVVEHSISALGSLKICDAVPTLIDIIISSERPIAVRETAIHQFSFNLKDSRIISTLEYIIKNEKNSKLRKAAIYAFGANIKATMTSHEAVTSAEMSVLFGALNDKMTEVRKQAADVLGYSLPTSNSVAPLIERLKIEGSISSRKSIVSSLSSLMKKGFNVNLIIPVLEKITVDQKEDFRVREEAKNGLEFYKRNLTNTTE